MWPDKGRIGEREAWTTETGVRLVLLPDRSVHPPLLADAQPRSVRHELPDLRDDRLRDRGGRVDRTEGGCR